MLSLLFSFTLGKGINFLQMAEKEGQGSWEWLNQATAFIQSTGMDNLKAIQFVEFGQGFDGMDLIINYILTYTPIFFLIFMFTIPVLKIVFSLIFLRKPKVSNKDKVVGYDHLKKSPVKNNTKKESKKFKLPSFKRKTKSVNDYGTKGS